MLDSLEQLGLTHSEAVVFCALLDKGPCFVAPLVSETKKHRQIVYNALSSLLEKSLISVSIKNGKQFYSIADPKRFLTLLKQKEVIAEEIAYTIEQKMTSQDEKVEVFSGVDAYNKGLSDFRLNAEEAQEYIVLGGDPGEWHQFTKSFFAHHMSELRRLKHQGIDIQTLFFDDARENARKYFYQYVGDPYTLKISSQTPHLPQTIWIAGDHVYLRTPVSEPLVIHINGKILAQKYRDYFYSLWNDAELIKA